MKRAEHIENLDKTEFDVLILGGGINGAVAAAALAGKGVKVALIDKDDFASGCSSNSSNLAWGGIKYLESGELLLVSKLCRSRNHLMRYYPSSVKEIRFFTTIRKGFRMPAFMVYLGALFYWLIGAFRTRAPRYLTPRRIRDEEPVIATEKVAGGLEYSDCYLPDNDSRFVFRFIRAAAEQGCSTANYVEALDSHFAAGQWTTQARDCVSGKELTIRSRVLINACGPWVDHYNRQLGVETEHHHLFSKGVHLIVDRITDHDRVLAFFASDGRLFFVIPMGQKTCIGTTDTPVKNPRVEVTEEDRRFILDNVNQLLDLATPLSTEDVIAERCGVRPLAVAQVGVDENRDWLKLSRRHAIDVDEDKAYVSIFGGKLTDCINVGEEVVAQVRSLGVDVPKPRQVWYGEPLPERKGQFMEKAAALKIDGMIQTLSGEALSERIWRRYGEFAWELLDEIAADPKQALAKPVAIIEYTRCELKLMARTEMIVTLDDFMRRRSKVAQVTRMEAMDRRGLLEICEILFGAHAESRLEEYLASPAFEAAQNELRVSG
ncbi:glycerol-3-phosphate dehydrogenase/oxidase [Proteobacteria bacterium 005FR1]|nr:glycerol-3-phosphate dehydrogenase/oxidase [Proteobacteria bacterium 005FR1]